MADDKPYQSLYRKYRPQGPSEVLGQDHVIRALSGAVREGRLAHAFLLCGPRGTGKTSTARILAKMVNCESGPTPEPCGSCDQCVAVRDGQHLDVVEIDAASHGGVDDARDLREKAPTAPVQGREKVYIIDEAQRLSREAFDALLKVFEEPPGRPVRPRHHRAAQDAGDDRRALPAVRLPPGPGRGGSRAPRTHREGRGHVDHLRGGARDRAADGGFGPRRAVAARPGLGAGAGEIGEDIVLSLIGSGRSDVQYALGDAVAVGDTKGVFELVSRLVQEGQDLRHVTNEVLAHFRNLLLVKTAPGQHDLLDATDEEAERLTAQAAKYSAAELGRVIALLIDAQTDMRWTTSPRLSLELALIRATIPETDAAPEALVSRLERLERVAGIQAGGGGSGVAVSGSYSPPPSPSVRRRLPGRRLPVARYRDPCAAGARNPRHHRRWSAWGPAAAGTGEAADSAPRRTNRRASDPRREPQRAAPKRPRPVRPRPVRRPSQARRCPCWAPGRRRWT